MLKYLALGLLLGQCASQVSRPQVEFYDMDGRRVDPCVNRQHLSPQNPDCTFDTKAPWQGTTYLIPAATSNAVRQLNQPTIGGAGLGTITISGKFFPVQAAGAVTQRLALGLPDVTTTAQCQVLSPDLAPVTPISSTLTTITWQVPAAWTQPTTLAPEGLELEEAPRPLCWSTDGVNYQWTGIRVASTWNCDDGSDNTALRCVNNIVPQSLNPNQAAIRAAKTTCCVNKVQGTIKVNQCINTRVETCCGASSVLPGMKCCNESIETVAWSDGVCPCRRNTKSTDCPNNEMCCLPNKYPEIADPTDMGECFNPRNQRCCDVGSRYDPGTQQCCSINGLQSLNVPCPCAQDSDCLGGQAWDQVTPAVAGGNGNLGPAMVDFICCQQTAPVPQEVLQAQLASATTCTKYNNYPSGNGDYKTQRCLGQCIDTKYQICCNGRACIREFEKCCNTTCCNRWNGTCQTGTYKAQSQSAFNWVEYNIPYEVCTTVEQMDLIRAWWMFVMPTFMLIATLTGLALSLVFAGRVEHRARRGLEKAVIGTALVAVLFSCPMYFAPIYKYGCVTVFASLFAIITAAARKLNMYVACIVVQGILILYLIDPFNGNNYLNLAVDRTPTGLADPAAAGLWHATSRIWDTHTSCWDFYNGYFRFDASIRDHVRFDEPNNPAFGYCSRGWVAALLVFDGIVIIAVFLQFILDVILLLARGSALVKKVE